MRKEALLRRRDARQQSRLDLECFICALLLCSNYL
jgi:hypothetical protein